MAGGSYQTVSTVSLGESNASVVTWNSGTAQNTTASILSADFSANTLIVTLSQTTTITGGVVTFQYSTDGVNWQNVTGVIPGTTTLIGPTYNLVANTYALFEFNVTGFSYFQVVLSTAITGTGAVTIGYSGDSFVGDTVTISAPISISGTVAVTQSGTWTVQQGGAPWSVTISGQPISVSQSGTWNIGTVATLTSITNAVTVAQSTAANLNATVTGTVAATQSGTWTVQQGTPPWTIQGDSASGAANAGNPVKIGGAFNTTQPTVTNAQTVDAQMTARGAQIVATGVDTFTVAVSGTVAVTQSTSPWVVSLASTTITGTVAVTQSTTPWTIQGDSASGAAKAGNPVQIGGVFNTTQPTVTTGQTVEAQATARGAQIVATGVDAFNVNATQTTSPWVVSLTSTTITGTVAVTQSTSPWVDNVTQWASTALGTPQTFGTAPTGVVIGTSSDIYVAGTRARSNQTTTAAGALDVNIVGSLGVTNSVTNGTFIAITDNTNKATVKAASTAPVAGDPALVVTVSPNSASETETVGTAGTLNALNATATISAPNQNSVGMFLAAGTLVGTIVPEVSFDGGTTWVSTFFDDPATSNKVSSIVFGASNTATSRTIIGAGGASNYRVRVSAFTSGTATCTLRGNSISDPTALYGGAPAAALPPVAAFVAGTDGSVLRGLLTDSTGKLQVASTSGASDTVGATVALNALNTTATVAMTGETSGGFLLAAGTLIGTIVPELSMDGGTTWTGTYFYDPATVSFSASLIFGSANTVTQRTILAAGGTSNIRVRVSAFTSGTANATLRSAVGQSGAFFTSAIDGEKNTFRACSALFYTSAATPTDSFIISGSSTKTVRISKIFIQPFAPSNSGFINMQIIKRSAANTGGTFVSDASTVAQMDSNDAATTVATVGHYTANPTSLGASAGVIDQAKMLLPTSPNAFQVPSEFDFGNIPGAKAIVLRGTSQFCCVNFNSSALPTGGMTVSVVVQYTEE